MAIGTATGVAIATIVTLIVETFGLTRKPLTLKESTMLIIIGGLAGALFCQIV